MNIGTAFVLLLLIAVVGIIIYGMVKDKREGKSSCGGDCAHCGHCVSSANSRKSS